MRHLQLITFAGGPKPFTDDHRGISPGDFLESRALGREEPQKEEDLTHLNV